MSRGSGDRVPAETVQTELKSDTSAICAVYRAAFPTDAEARLVERRHERGKAIISLVAEVRGAVAPRTLRSVL